MFWAVFQLKTIIIIKNRLQGCGHSKKLPGKWKRVTQQQSRLTGTVFFISWKNAFERTVGDIKTSSLQRRLDSWLHVI